MKHLPISFPDPAGTNLRAVVATIAGTLSSLSGQFTPEEVKTALDSLTASWGELVNQLALGQESEYRECPKGGHIALRRTTLCSDCLSYVMKLDPLAPGESLG